MFEVREDLRKLSPDPGPRQECLKLVTTNGECRKDGTAVMGRGGARQAKDFVPGVEYKLGGLLAEHGHRVRQLTALPAGTHLGNFPVKHGWREEAAPELIERSAEQLIDYLVN